MLGVGRGVEVAVKYGGLVFRGNAAAGVLHTDESRALRLPAVDGDGAARRGVVDGVGHEILQDLLQPHRIAPDGQCGVELCAKGNALVLRFAPAVLADCLRGLAQGNAVFVQQDLFLFQLGRKEEVFGQPPQKAHPLLQSGQEGRQGLRGRFQRVQSAGHREQRAAQVVEDVQHHALAGLGLLGQGAGAVGHTLVQLPRQLLGAVKLQREPAADEGHAAQGEGNIVDAGTPHHIEADALREKGKIQPRQNDQHPQADRCRTGEEEEQHRAVSPPVGRDEQPDAVGHAAQQPDGPHRRAGAEGEQNIPSRQCQREGLLLSGPGGHAGQRRTEPDGGQHREGKIPLPQKQHHTAAPLRQADDRSRPGDEDDEIEQEISKLPLRLVVVQCQHGRRQRAEDRDGHPLQGRADGAHIGAFVREGPGPFLKQDFGILSAGSGARFQRRKLGVVPDTGQRDAQRQHHRAQCSEKMFGFHG